MSIRPTVARIDLKAVADNCRAMQTLLTGPTHYCQVVKADGYGHGAVEIARTSLEAGAERVAVALVEEGLALRAGGIEVPILLLIEAPSTAARQIVEGGLTPSICTPDFAAALQSAASEAGEKLSVHVCVDTGMHREGESESNVQDLLELVAASPNLDLEGFWSHFASADVADDPSIDMQLEAFTGLAEVARSQFGARIVHMANSAATIARPDSHFDLVRCGITGYGLYPSDWMKSKVSLCPALSVVSEVGLVRRIKAGEAVSYGLTWTASRDTTLATIPIGYADGFPRLLSNSADVLVGGKRRKVVGRVTMDTIIVDCGDDQVSPGQEAVVIGAQGSESVSADELAATIGTINYEIVCGIGPRVPREYGS